MQTIKIFLTPFTFFLLLIFVFYFNFVYFFLIWNDVVNLFCLSFWHWFFPLGWKEGKRKSKKHLLWREWKGENNKQMFVTLLGCKGKKEENLWIFFSFNTVHNILSSLGKREIKSARERRKTPLCLESVILAGTIVHGNSVCHHLPGHPPSILLSFPLSTPLLLYPFLKLFFFFVADFYFDVHICESDNNNARVRTTTTVTPT